MHPFLECSIRQTEDLVYWLSEIFPIDCVKVLDVFVHLLDRGDMFVKECLSTGIFIYAVLSTVAAFPDTEYLFEHCCDGCAHPLDTIFLAFMYFCMLIM